MGNNAKQATCVPAKPLAASSVGVGHATRGLRHHHLHIILIVTLACSLVLCSSPWIFEEKGDCSQSNISLRVSFLM